MPFYELTEWGPMVLALTLLAAAVVIAVVVLPRRWGPGWRKHVEQTVVLVLVTVLAVTTLFLELNADNVWYGSWSDLMGGNATAPAASTRVGAPDPTVDRPVSLTGLEFSALQHDPRSDPDFGPQLDSDARDGQWVSFPFTGPTTGITQNVTVWLPPSYLSHPDQAYPVITAFTGYPGSPDTYIRTVRYDQIIRDQVSRGKMREAIVVIPDMFPGDLDTECVDGAHGKYESWVAVDLVDWIGTNLRVASDPQAWATTGYSAGGWCATMFAVRHPQRWPRAINLAGYFAPEYSPGQEWIDPADHRYDLGATVAEQRPAVNIWFFTGGQDDDPRKAVAGFRRYISAPTSLTITVSSSGGHRADVWTPAMGDSLAWLGATSGYFAPSG